MKRVNNLKEALCALCRVLSASGLYWDPETIRRSKFNRPEAVKFDCNSILKIQLCFLLYVDGIGKNLIHFDVAASEFWTLLYCLLKHIFIGRRDTSPSAHEEITMADRVRYVKSVLQIQGYGRPGFYSLPDDGEEGSREILLAFSWLLHRVKILEMLLAKKRVKVGDYITICSCPHDVLIQKYKDSSSSTKKNEDVRFLQWMNGKLQFCWKTLYAAHLEECTILHKMSSLEQWGCCRLPLWSNENTLEIIAPNSDIFATEIPIHKGENPVHSYTQGCHVDKTAGHLSVMEIELIRQPKSYHKLLQAMESEMSCLEAYMEWKHVESVYWQWMDTVLESACEDDQSCSTETRSSVCTFATSSSQPLYLPTDIKVLSKCLRDTQDELHKLAALRNPLSQEKIKETETQFSEKELKKMKQEVKKKIQHCKPQGIDAKDIHGSYRVILKERKLQRSVNKDCSRDELHVTEVTKCLQTAIRKMETVYEELQEQCRRRLDDITEELEGIICIPPARG